MTDLRQAAQQALDALVQLDGLDTETESVTIDVGDVIAALKAALEQQAEPPPEWPLIKNILAVFGLDAIAFVAEWKAAQQQAEPPQRPWVGLTDEEIKRLGDLDLDSNYFGLWYDFARAIEAKLKEQNT